MKYVILIAAILLIRLPFLNQAVTGDDVYYLASAEHAQIDPLHPNHTHYVFQGKDVDFRGYPHPPLNAWALAGLLAIYGDVREVPFHAAYILFSVIAGLAMVSLAERFSPHPVWAVLLFLAVPAFVVNGNSFESDVPSLAFWMAGMASFVRGVDRRSVRWLAVAAVSLGLASLVAVQAVVAVPILAVYVWLTARDQRLAWIGTLSPVVALAAWQVFEYFSIGQFPILITSGYVQSYALAKLQLKVTSALGLFVHALFLVCPILLLFVLPKKWDADAKFLVAWIGIFFAAAVAMFYSGSARYLLPMAAPVVLLVSRAGIRWLAIGFVSQMALSLMLASVNYQHWGGYRDFARSVAKETKSRRTWVNGEWGLRWYMEADGARPMHDHEQIPPDSMVVSSELAYPAPYNRGGSVIVPLVQREIRSTIPLRLIGLDSHAGYSTSQKGLLPFGISNGPIDRVRADLLVAREPKLEYLPMDAKEAEDQIISGIYGLEDGRWRWMAGSATIALKQPAEAKPVHVELYIPDSVPARGIRVFDGEREILSKTFDKPGIYGIDTPPVKTGMITLKADKAITAPGDGRELSLILTGVGYR